MGGLFGGPKVSSGPSAEEKKAVSDREAANAARDKELQAAQNAKLKAMRGRAAGRRSLLSGLETGTEDTKTTLG